MPTYSALAAWSWRTKCLGSRPKINESRRRNFSWVCLAASREPYWAVVLSIKSLIKPKIKQFILLPGEEPKTKKWRGGEVGMEKAFWRCHPLAFYNFNQNFQSMSIHYAPRQQDSKTASQPGKDSRKRWDTTHTPLTRHQGNAV